MTKSQDEVFFFFLENVCMYVRIEGFGFGGWDIERGKERGGGVGYIWDWGLGIGILRGRWRDGEMGKICMKLSYND